MSSLRTWIAGVAILLFVAVAAPQAAYANECTDGYQEQISVLLDRIADTSSGLAQQIMQLQIQLLQLQMQTCEGVPDTDDGDVDPDAPLALTVPNGGERWEVGSTNSITWTPYGYNPEINVSSDVKAYLEKKKGNGFVKVGEIVPSGKASIHWDGQINDYNEWPSPGSYYIRIVNEKTGESDRSDKAFTLTERSVDIKVNGSDGPVDLEDGEKIVISWKTKGSFTSCSISSISNNPNLDYSTGFGSVGKSGRATAYYTGDGSPIGLNCDRSDGTGRYDSVYVNFEDGSTSAMINVDVPNGGEVINPDREMQIAFNHRGVDRVSLALYKNDKWKYWIYRDQPIEKDLTPYSWVPSSALQGLGEGDNAGAIFKIYVTGHKSDGTGYVDDKSNQAFSFGATNTPPAANNTRINVDVEGERPLIVGNTYRVSWRDGGGHFGLSGVPIDEVMRKFPNAVGHIHARNQDMSTGIGQTVAKKLTKAQILSGRTDWTILDYSNDGREMPTGGYRIEMDISLPSGVVLANGTGGLFNLEGEDAEEGAEIVDIDLDVEVLNQSAAPLQVIATAEIEAEGPDCPLEFPTPTLTWGDGTTGSIMAQTVSTAGNSSSWCRQTLTMAYDHTYSAAGSYTLVFKAGGLTKSVTIQVAGTGTSSGTVDNQTYATPYPTLTGTARGTSAVGLNIVKGDKIYGSGKILVSSGRWSHVVSESIPAGTYDVVLYNYGTNARIASGTITIQLRSEGTTSCSASVTPSSITRGSAAVLKWSSKNASYVLLDGEKAEASDSKSVSPTATKTYYFTVLGMSGGKSACSTTLTVTEPETPGPAATPTVTFSGPRIATAESGAMLSWSTTNAKRCVLSSSDGNEWNVPVNNDNYMVYPYETTTYRLWCANDTGGGKDGPSAEKSITVRIFERRDGRLEASALMSVQSQLDAILKGMKELFGN